MLDLDGIQRIAQLARIELTADEAARLKSEFAGIFALIEQLTRVETQGIEPMAHAQEVYQRLREDVVTEPDQREALQALAPQAADGLYLVPKVIE